MKRVLVVHPWLPEYRVPFFERLAARLAGENMELQVAHGTPPPEVEGRGDAAEASWSLPLRTRQLRLGSRTLTTKSLPSLTDVDLIILEQGIRNLENLRVLGDLNRPTVALWGHGRTYNRTVAAPHNWVKTRMTNRADWFFAYTEGGANYVEAKGFPRDRVTVVQNSCESVDAELDQTLTEADVERYRLAHDILATRVGLYIGGLDSPKRIPYLLEAGAGIAKADRDFQLVVAGDGRDRALVEEKRVPWLRYVGRVGPKEKTILSRIAQLMLVPGTVGLVAIDSFSMALPLVTTDWRFHSPEYEYLVPGENSWIAGPSPQQYAAGVADLLAHPERRATLVNGCRGSASRYSIEAMVDNFVQGVDLALESGRR